MSDRTVLICAMVFVLLYLATSAFFILAEVKGFPKKEKKERFDERQIAAQGFAYKVAFCVMLTYYSLYAVIGGAAEIVWCDPFLGAFLGVILGVTVFAIICIFRDAYFAQNQSSASAIIVINVCCASQGILAWNNLSERPIIENGVLSGNSIQLFLVLTGLTLDAAIVIKHMMEKHGERTLANEES